VRNIYKVVIVSAMLSAPAVQAANLYSTLPSPTLPNESSLGYQANQTAEFGALVQLSGGDPHTLDSATVAMSDWAYESQWAGVGTASGFTVPLTLNIYNVGAGNSVGSLVDSVTVNALIPWRPEPNPGACGAGATQYQGSDGNCYNGSLSTVTFNFSGVTVPDEFIYGLAFNTETWGASPLGVDGPYDSLNFALSSDPPTVGSNPLPDTAYWNTSTAANYTDGGTGGVGIFRQDTNWTPFSGAIQFDGTATPEPSTLLLVSLSLVGLASRRIRAGSR
jgi:PEP-CTERM motif